MKILIAHNHYQQPGGEDIVFENEARLLTSAGHDVRTLVVSNDMIASPIGKALAAIRTVENPVGIAAMAQALEGFRPDLVHVHNFFPLLSPAVYRVCHSAGIPVVQTLHNYRAICSAALLLRKGKTCRLCVKGSPIWGVIHRCYRGSVIGSAAAGRMIAVHRKRQTWSKAVDRYIALTEFGRSIFVEAGFPPDRTEIKPNFIEDPGAPSEDWRRDGVLYVGRLSSEKGVRYLVEACTSRGYPLRIAGSGPELAALRESAPPNVTILGNLSRDAVMNEMKHAAVLVVPSIWYEGFPMVIIEAFACATPVIASKIGALAELVEDGATGFHVPAANSPALAERIGLVLQNPADGRRLGRTARRIFMERYIPEVNLRALETIYNRAIDGFLVQQGHRR
jgi:glycosyltransferase involved in cell wall biosynthesis